MWSEETHLPVARVGGNGENLHPLLMLKVLDNMTFVLVLWFQWPWFFIC
jgi:hypothetical protein